MKIYLEQPWTSGEVWEMSARIVANSPDPMTLVLRRSSPAPPANAGLEAVVARVA